ncbi:DUF4198 domain-containing protein [Fodinibius halophilus]|uniref:DUF4198 domain-containing protein n=1 Tax=Fodinibius halophilus TaxID=1736908 RepID=A0A6M1TBQ0_9BACT|nr:DUF4198 domain-containing protein [Fodinibius halophilus]NGP87702.1 DUF4198 domain-containing protein [Fodinibius halophilus]
MNLQNTLLKASLFCLFSLFTLQVSAHNLWIETAPTANIGEHHRVSIYMGEYSYGVRENIKEHRKEIGPITLYLIEPDGTVAELETTIDGNRFVARFTPKTKGTYRLALNVTKAPVVDWREYDLGILKTNFFSSAVVEVAAPKDHKTSMNPVSDLNELLITPTTTAPFERNTPVTFQLTFQGKPLPEQEIKVGYKDKWFKTLYTDEQGQLTVSFPWNGQFVIETVHTEQTSGSFQGEEYEAIRHTATYVIPRQK